LKILFLTSFYSGLKRSVETGTWNPSGMPAIYKLLEGFKEKQINFDYCFVDKNITTTKEFSINFFKASRFFVLGCASRYKSINLLNKIIYKPLYFIKLYKFLKKINVNDYNIVYIDRSNVSAFLIIHLFFKVNGILRLHGIGLQYVKFKKSKVYFVKNVFNFISYKLPFKFIIASRDGTPVDKFLEEFTNKKSRKVILLNGVDSKISEKKYNNNNNKINFLFVGRLEKDKGIVEIVESFKRHKLKDEIYLTIIGDGSLKEYVRKHTSQVSHINFVGSLTHDEVNKYYITSDVFISFNYLGNISNVVLEKDIENEKDIDSNDFLGENVIYVSRKTAVESLMNTINILHENDKYLEIFKFKVRENLLPKITSWEERINKEIEIIINNQIIL